MRQEYKRGDVVHFWQGGNINPQLAIVLGPMSDFDDGWTSHFNYYLLMGTVKFNSHEAYLTRTWPTTNTA